LWRDFLQVLDRETRTPAFQDQAVDGAVMGFEAAERWFIGAEAAA
jgi:heme oxygenase